MPYDPFMTDEEQDADLQARQLSNLLRTVAAKVPLEPVEGMVGKEEGDLAGECPFHVIASVSREARHVRRRERTLYITLAERRWHCIRCGVGGDAAEFSLRLELEDRAQGPTPTARVIRYHGGPNDEGVEELGVERFLNEGKDIIIREPYDLPTDIAASGGVDAILAKERDRKVIGVYKFTRRDGDILHYQWHEGPQRARRGKPQ